MGSVPIAWQRKQVGIVVDVSRLCQGIRGQVAGVRSVSIFSAPTVLQVKTEASLLHENLWHYTGVGDIH